MLTLELGLDQGAAMCQVERRMGGISGPSRLQVQRHGGTTKNGTCEVHGMSETDGDMGRGRLTKPGLQRAKESVLYSKGNGGPWEVLSRGLIPGLPLRKFSQLAMGGRGRWQWDCRNDVDEI